MNDFTKEELLRLGASIAYTYVGALLDPSFSNEVKEEYKIIKDKIEYMIDNYCEHDWDNPCCGCIGLYCTKCNKELE